MITIEFAGHRRNVHEQTIWFLLPFNLQSLLRGKTVEYSMRRVMLGECRDLWKFISEGPYWDLGDEGKVS